MKLLTEDKIEYFIFKIIRSCCLAAYWNLAEVLERTGICRDSLIPLALHVPII
jgi:hypothetical protein